MSFPAIILRAAPLRGLFKRSCAKSIPTLSRKVPAYPYFERYRRFATAAEEQLTQHNDDDLDSRPFDNSTRLRRQHLIPSIAIATFVKNRGRRLSPDIWRILRATAVSKSFRLPILFVQWMIRHDEAKRRTRLSDYLVDERDWKIRLNYLAFKGINEWDLEHWNWILEAKDSDSKIQRFVANEAHKPIFILHHILASDEDIINPASLLELMNYVSRHYCRTPIQDGPPLPWGAVRRTLDGRQNMVPNDVINLLQRLVFHCARIWPSGIVNVAQLTAAYIKTIPTSSEPDLTGGYAQRCMVFNYALKLFERPARSSPLMHRRDNWKAQKLLLGMSLGLEKPLIIEKDSYRAIRMVLIGLPKSDPEQRVATRLTSSWPPYRKSWDGIDEQRQPQENLSMSVKSGVLSREAGNPENNIDRSLGVVGGAVLGEYSSIQTRSLPPPIWKGCYAALNMYTEWAARVRATRNSNEAWQMFNQKPAEDIKPNTQVYAELFQKLYALEAFPGNLPGDGREHFPVYDANLTDVEKARVAPPGVEELYHRMLNDGNRPQGKCLVVLVRHAPNLEAAWHYLVDSGLNKDAIRSLTNSPEPELVLLSEIPLPVFTAYIRLLCRIQPNYLERRRPRRHRASFLKRFKNFQRAILLLESRFPSSVLLSESTHKAPWYHVMETLAVRNKTFHPDKSLQSTDTDSLTFFLGLIDRRRQAMETDTKVFFLLNRMVRKAFRWRNQSTLSGVSDAMNTDVPPTLLAKRDREAQRFNEVITLAYSKLKDMFEKLRTPAQPLVVNATEVDAPALLHTIRPQHIHVYLRTAAMFRDVDEVIRVMDWVLQAWELDSVLEDAKSPDFRGQYSLMARVFAFFRAYGDKYIEPEVMSRFESQLRELNEQKGCTWHWPSDEEVEEYNAFAFSEEGLPSLFDDPYLKQAGTSATDLVRGAEVNKPNDDNLVDTGAEEGIEDEDIENRKDQDLDEFEEEEEEEDVDDETLAKKQKFGSRRSSRQRRRKNK